MIAQAAWNSADLVRAFEQLGSNQKPRERCTPSPAGSPVSSLSERQLIALAKAVQLEVRPQPVLFGTDRFSQAPLCCPLDSERRLWLVVCRLTQQHAFLLTPDLNEVRVERASLWSALWRREYEGAVRQVDELMLSMELQNQRVKSAIVDCYLKELPPKRAYILSADHAPPLQHLGRDPVLLRTLSLLVFVHAVQYVLWLLSWLIIGRAAFGGTLDLGYFLGWALVLITIIPFRLWSGMLQGGAAIHLGTRIKSTLMNAALSLDKEVIANQGAGALLGRVLESEAIETLAVAGGLIGVTALVELAFAGAVLALGANGSLQIALLFSWFAAIIVLSKRYYHARRNWTHGADRAVPSGGRLALTNDLTEAMLGQRTRRVQENPDSRHAGEDRLLAGYHQAARKMDEQAAFLSSVMPRGWLIVGMLGLAPALAASAWAQPQLAIGIGGVVLVYRSLGALSAGLSYLTAAHIAWEEVRPLLEGSSVIRETGEPGALVAQARANGRDSTVVELDDLSFRYQRRPKPVLNGCSLRVRRGERLLIEGASGSGKSTLALLLSGQARPESGILLVEGLDLATAGFEHWRRNVVATPQFHENHVLTESLAFNLLLGRTWPPSAEDLREAEAVCRELGLGALLERMPAGILQLVGETGWQLSHGEKSRLYIARALLQDPEVLVLDESFGALDPDSMQTALKAVLSRARTLVVIAHP